MARPWIKIVVVKPGDARGWIGLGCFIMALLVLGMIKFERELLDSDAFLILATAIIITGWVQGPVGWAYQATKSGGELADKNAEIIKQRAETDANPALGLNDPDRPTGTASDPVHVEQEKPR
ncbi:MAG: hypothetical protein V4696_01520 [Pseudomonadota bacterium]